MRRFFSTFFVSLLIVCFFHASFAQQTRYRLPTQAGASESEVAPSFRGTRSIDGQDLPEPPMQGYGFSSQGSQGESGLSPAMVGSGYNVHVLGEVRRPGTYFVPASTRLAQAIQLAGGAAENGSQRNVELRRKGGKTRRVDLLRFLLYGNLNDNPYLVDNDVVFVPLMKKVVRVAGAVRRPEIYEINNEQTLGEVIQLAGGFNNAVAKDEPIRVIRFIDGKKVVDEIAPGESEMQTYGIRSGDVIVVANVITKDTKFDYNVASIPGDQVFYPSYEDRVFVLGGVAAPGAYPFSPYYTLSQYISLAGGLTDRGKDSYRVTGIDGKTRSAKLNERVNPGDTIIIKQKVMSNAAWAGFGLSIASFGLAASSTVIALTK